MCRTCKIAAKNPIRHQYKEENNTRFVAYFLFIQYIIFYFICSPKVQYSLACAGCQVYVPFGERFASFGCGHVFCRECTVGSLACPCCEEPTVFIKLFEDEEDYRQCRICLCPTPELIMVLTDCGHTVCHDCVLQLLSNNRKNKAVQACPMCRKPVQLFPFSLIEFEIEPSPESSDYDDTDSYSSDTPEQFDCNSVEELATDDSFEHSNADIQEHPSAGSPELPIFNIPQQHNFASSIPRQSTLSIQRLARFITRKVRKLWKK